MTEAIMVQSNHSNNNNDEWFTPPEYIESARRVLGAIQCDPASSDAAQRTVQAHHYYTKDNDSLLPENTWHGSVWMNPPYSRIIKKFVSKLVSEYNQGRVTDAIVVTNNGTDTLWYHELMTITSAICCVRGRIGFLNEAGERVDNNNKGQIFYYIGDDVVAFRREFSQYGKILEVC